jgi:hypothetical protein
MSVIEPGPASSTSLIDRVKAILLSPATEWDKIDAEPATAQGLYTGYAMILAAIPAVAQIIGGFIPMCFFGVCIHHNPIFVIVGAIVSYLVNLAGIYLVAIIANELAPSFGGQKNQIQALKLIIYSATASWLCGIFLILPALGLLTIVGLYGVYLLYVGAPKLMKVPADKSLGYVVVTGIAAAVVLIVVAVVSGAVLSMGAIGASGIYASNAPASVDGTLHVGGASVDLGKLQQASQQMQAAANQIQAQANGQTAVTTVKAVPADTLKALLPAALPAGYARTESSSSSGGVAGVTGSTAESIYSKGDQRITLQVTDMAAAGALMTLGGAVNVQSDKETATGYEKMGKVDGRMTTEEFDRQSKSGKYSVLVANRFLVEADGEGADVNDLKGAGGSVGLDRLEGLART